MAKGKNDTYNEAYQYMANRSVPNRFLKVAKSRKNWSKEINRKFNLLPKPTNHYTNSRFQCMKNKKELFIVPLQEETTNIIQKAHNNFLSTNIKHFGMNATSNNLKKMGIFWSKMNEDISKFIKKCKIFIMDKYEFPIK